MTCIKMGSDESHFNVSLIVRDKVTRPCPQITTFEGKGYPKWYRTEVLPLANLPPYRWAKPALCSRFRSPLLYLLHADHVKQFYGKRKTWEDLQKKFIDSYSPPPPPPPPPETTLSCARCVNVTCRHRHLHENTSTCRVLVCHTLNSLMSDHRSIKTTFLEAFLFKCPCIYTPLRNNKGPCTCTHEEE